MALARQQIQSCLQCASPAPEGANWIPGRVPVVQAGLVWGRIQELVLMLGHAVTTSFSSILQASSLDGNLLHVGRLLDR